VRSSSRTSSRLSVARVTRYPSRRDGRRRVKDAAEHDIVDTFLVAQADRLRPCFRARVNAEGVAVALDQDLEIPAGLPPPRYRP
jgi:hypothetical protein